MGKTRGQTQQQTDESTEDKTPEKPKLARDSTMVVTAKASIIYDYEDTTVYIKSMKIFLLRRKGRRLLVIRTWKRHVGKQ